MIINEQYLYYMTWYTSTYGRTIMSLLYKLDPMVTKNYFYIMMALRFNGFFCDRHTMYGVMVTALLVV
jgi:hypothetical protein